MRRKLLKWFNKVGLRRFIGHFWNLEIFLKSEIYYYLDKYFGYMPVPKKIFYEPTHGCNLDCQMCYLNKEFRSDFNHLKLEQVKFMINNRLKGIKQVTMIGGEPFMRKDIFDIIDEFEKNNVRMHFATNATVLWPERIQMLKKYKLIRSIGTSIDGNDPKVHDMIRRQAGAFKKTTESIKQIGRFVPTTVTSVILEENLHTIPDMVKLGKELGVATNFFLLEKRYTKNDIQESARILGIPADQDHFPLLEVEDHGYVYPEEKIRGTLNNIEKISKDLNQNVVYFPPNIKSVMKLNFAREMRKKKKYFCQDFFTGRVDHHGNVYHCFAIRAKFGNLMEKSFEEIWKSKEYKEFRKRFSNGKMPPICEACHYMRKIV